MCVYIYILATTNPILYTHIHTRRLGVGLLLFHLCGEERAGVNISMYIYVCVCRCVYLYPPPDDDKFTPTKHLTPPPRHSSSRPAAAHTET